MSDLYVFENFETVGDFTVLNNDATTLATSATRLTGAANISFAKANGSADTVYGGVYKTLSGEASKVFNKRGLTPLDRIGMIFYVSDTTNVAGGFIRLGSSDANYVEWRMADTHAGWNCVTQTLGVCYATGTSIPLWGSTDPVYLACGVQFDAETNALAGILMDCLFFAKNVPTL